MLGRVPPKFGALIDGLDVDPPEGLDTEGRVEGLVPPEGLETEGRVEGRVPPEGLDTGRRAPPEGRDTLPPRLPPPPRKPPASSSVTKKLSSVGIAKYTILIIVLLS